MKTLHIDPIIEQTQNDWTSNQANMEAVKALEIGQVLRYKNLPFKLLPEEIELLTPDRIDPKVRNISFNAEGLLKGVVGDRVIQQNAKRLIQRFRELSVELIRTSFPKYVDSLKVAPTSFRPNLVETRIQSWRADDRRLHVDAFPSRPNYGERILRVFINLNPAGVSRVWRVGEPFEEIVQRFKSDISPYSPLKAKILNSLGITKSYRSEYDHMMLNLHDLMKADTSYQASSAQKQVEFLPGEVWVCFSDQTAHAAMSGQFMMEQTLHLPASAQYNPDMSPLGVLEKVMGRRLT
jgi:hypothetical protein